MNPKGRALRPGKILARCTVELKFQLTLQWVWISCAGSLFAMANFHSTAGCVGPTPLEEASTLSSVFNLDNLRFVHFVSSSVPSSPNRLHTCLDLDVRVSVLAEDVRSGIRTGLGGRGMWPSQPPSILAGVPNDTGALPRVIRVLCPE